MARQQQPKVRNPHHRELVARTSAAIADLLASGRRISFYSVAARAAIARSTLYRCNDLRNLVEAARNDASRPSASELGIASEGATAVELEAALHRVTLERDFLLRVLNAGAEKNSFRAVSYALVSLDSVA